MVTRVISLTLRNLYYTSPTNTNPLRRVSRHPLGVTCVADMLNGFFGSPTHDLTFIEGALELCRKGEMATLFHGRCPPGPWVQVNSGTGQRHHVRLPGPAQGNNVQSACCFLNGDHTVSHRYKNDNCCKMLCQVQTPYLEIFNLSVFPIFTDNWGCTICANCE